MSRGLGPWSDSYGVGCKSVGGGYQQAYTLYGKDATPGEVLAYHEAEVDRQTRYLRRRIIKDRAFARHERREYKAVTKAGYRAKERAERIFWVSVIGVGFFAVLVPVAIKAMTFFWTWALS